MKPLVPPQRVSRLLSFDFDGTLHDPAGNPPVPVEFFELLRNLREPKEIVWGINTGRSMPHMMEGFLESRFPILPDWIVAREREVYFPNHFGRWVSHQPWNSRCENDVLRLFKRLRKLLASIRHEVEQHTGARWMELDGDPAGIISRTEAEMEWIVSHIAPMVADEPLLSWQRNSIYLRFGHRDYQKGSSLSEVARVYQVPSTRCFAMGDSHNDQEMLDPTHAGMIACPANAVDEIQSKVTAHGGIITRSEYGAGAIEALRHYFGE